MWEKEKSLLVVMGLGLGGREAGGHFSGVPTFVSQTLAMRE